MGGFVSRGAGTYNGIEEYKIPRCKPCKFTPIFTPFIGKYGKI